MTTDVTTPESTQSTALTEGAEALPPAVLDTTEGPMRVRRAWPQTGPALLPQHRSKELAVDGLVSGEQQADHPLPLGVTSEETGLTADEAAPEATRDSTSADATGADSTGTAAEAAAPPEQLPPFAVELEPLQPRDSQMHDLPHPPLRAGWWDRRELILLEAGHDPKVTSLPKVLGWQHAELISHRPGKRAVVRHRWGGDTQFTKVVRRGKSAGILDGLRRGASFSGPFRMPEVIASTDTTVTFSAVAGESLHTPEHFTTEQWRQAWAEALEAWRQGVFEAAAPLSADESTGQSLPDQMLRGQLVHRAEAEAGVLRHWHRLTEPFIAEDVTYAVDAVADQLDALPAPLLRPAHRDLHDKQLVWDPHAGPGLLDVDTACLADPALDLGNLRAHAALRWRQGLWTGDQAETVSFCVDETAEQSGTPHDAVAVYEQAALLRLGFVYAVRPQYTAVAAQLRHLITPEVI